MAKIGVSVVAGFIAGIFGIIMMFILVGIFQRVQVPNWVKMVALLGVFATMQARLIPLSQVHQHLGLAGEF